MHTQDNNCGPSISGGNTILSAEEHLRYRRQIALPLFGLDAQMKLRQSRVLVVGAGGLGSPAAIYLAAAGIGAIGIVDHDTVETSNLHRQPLHGTSDVGRSKLLSARERLREINPLVQVLLYDDWLTRSNALDIIRGYDLVLDGTDNFATRYLINDACVLLGKPNVYGSVYRFEGQASVLCAPDGPCYRCLHPTPPPPDSIPDCAEGGVIGVMPGLIGTIQATEAIKVLTGVGSALIGRLLMIDALSMEFRSMEFERNPECPSCGTRSITELIDYDEFCGVSTRLSKTHGAAGSHAQDSTNSSGSFQEISPTTLLEWQMNGFAATGTIIDVREPAETEHGTIDGAMLIPLGELGSRLPSIPRDHTLVVVCASGVRSMRAAHILLSAGFSDVHSLAGGMNLWNTMRTR